MQRPRSLDRSRALASRCLLRIPLGITSIYCVVVPADHGLHYFSVWLLIAWAYALVRCVIDDPTPSEILAWPAVCVVATALVLEPVRFILGMLIFANQSQT